jgi:hypothetical protein
VRHKVLERRRLELLSEEVSKMTDSDEDQVAREARRRRGRVSWDSKAVPREGAEGRKGKEGSRLTRCRS